MISAEILLNLWLMPSVIHSVDIKESEKKVKNIFEDCDVKEEDWKMYVFNEKY